MDYAARCPPPIPSTSSRCSEHEKAAALRRARLAASGNADPTVHPTTAAEAGVSPEQWGCVRPKGQETAHSEEKGHRKSHLAEDKAGSRHANTASVESVYKPASASHTDIKPASPTPEAKRTPPRADGKPAASHGETKPPSQRANAKPLPHGETKPPPQRADTKPSKPAPQHGEAKQPSAQSDKANNRVGTTKSGTGT
jgi:hypothetical protein